jgi:hypothetical protein
MDTTKLEQLLDENIRLMKAAQSRERRRTFMRMFGYLLTIALLYWGYVSYLKPYVGTLEKMYDSLGKTFEDIQGARQSIDTVSKSLKGK